jgi:hypothetical protein
MEQRWYASAFGFEPQWVEAAETADATVEKADVLETGEAAETADAAEKAEAMVEKDDALETLVSNLEA